MAKRSRANVKIVGDGLRVIETIKNPGGTLYFGGYDIDANSLLLGSAGHAHGMSLAGGDPSRVNVAGVSLFLRSDGEVFWANDSISLPRKLTAEQIDEVQSSLERLFPKNQVRNLNTIGQAPK